MAKMTIYDFARSLQEKLPDLKSKDLVELLQANGYEAKSAQSSIEDEAIAFLMKYYKKKMAQPAAKQTKEAVKPVKEVKKEDAKAEEKKAQEPVKKTKPSAESALKEEKPEEKKTESKKE